MITLITAAPGGGKTAYVVGVMMQQAMRDGRPIYCAGIPELLVPHIPVPPETEWTREVPNKENPHLPAEHYFTFPEGSLIVLDEAQRYFRLRTNGSAVPPKVQAFETHRHTGVDFVLMTQHPQLIDVNVRKLVGRHIHLRDVGLLGRWFYEWPECNDPSTYRHAPIKIKYRLPKEAFSLYKSSSKHIKPYRTVPPVLYVLAVALISAIGLGWYVYGRIQQMQQPTKPPAAQRETSGPISKAQTLAQDIGYELIPRVPDRPETAPIYDPLRTVKDMPQVAGCVRTSTDCACYTQQGSRALVSYTYCENWMTGNRPFNPYREPIQAPQGEQVTEPIKKGPTTLAADNGVPPWKAPIKQDPLPEKQGL